MIKNCLNYCLNLRNKVLESKLLIFIFGVIVGTFIRFDEVISSIPTGIWVLASFGSIVACYLLYVKYKINQDIFGDF